MPPQATTARLGLRVGRVRQRLRARSPAVRRASATLAARCSGGTPRLTCGAMYEAQLSSSGTAEKPARVHAVSRPVEIRDAADLPYEAFLREYMVPRRPVHLRGAVASWPALAKWTPEYFKTRFATKQVAVSYKDRMPFAEFVDQVLASTVEKPGPYMFRLFLHEELPEVLPDLIPQNPYAFPGRYASPLMFEYYRRPDGYLKLLFGGIGGSFPVMHFDGDESHAAITEIYGDKEFLLYSPDDTPYLYPSPTRANHSLVDDPYEQDLARFPLLTKATQYRAYLKPGDTIFVPAGWWHSARAATTSISVCQNMVFAPDWNEFVHLTTGDSPSLKTRGKKAYLAAAGAVMSAMETVQRRFPRAAKALRLPAMVAPISSTAMTRDPSTKRLRIRVSTG